MKLFKGSIQSRKNKKTVCVKNITEDYNFEAQFSFGKCGIEKQVCQNDLNFKHPHLRTFLLRPSLAHFLSKKALQT